MKKAFILPLAVAALAMMFASCTPHKQACAAYSKTELPADK